MTIQNIILITIDCLRADHIGPIELTPSITPTLDRLGEEGIIFRKAFSCGPRTAESFPAILTSSYPLMYNIDGHHLSPRRTSLATVLQRRGLLTAAMHSNPVLSAQYNYDVGFDFFWDSLSNTGGAYRVGWKLGRYVRRLGKLYKVLRKIYHFSEIARNIPPFVRAEMSLCRARQWLQQRDLGRRFFLWLHLMDLHNPYLPLPAYQSKFFSKPLPKRYLFELSMRAMDNADTLSDEEITTLKMLYQAQINYVDTKLGEFIQSLRDAAILDNTLLIVTADHGEEFGEHGGMGHAAFVHRVQDGKVAIKLYDELLHVPLLLYAPGISWTCRDISELVSLLDLSPTIIELLALPPVLEWQGESLVPLIDGTGQRSAEGVLAEYQVRGENRSREPVVAYRTLEWKFIYDGLFGKHELYNLSDDSQEQINIAALYPGVARRMQGVVEEHISSLVSDLPPTDMEKPVDDKVLERLKALGYIE